MYISLLFLKQTGFVFSWLCFELPFPKINLNITSPIIGNVVSNIDWLQMSLEPIRDISGDLSHSI